MFSLSCTNQTYILFFGAEGDAEDHISSDKTPEWGEKFCLYTYSKELF